MWFQHDGGTPHFESETIELFKVKINHRVISNNDDINWAPRSCDFTQQC